MSTPKRTHLVASAGRWFEAAYTAQKEKSYYGALCCMENAYNHVENALAASREEADELRKVSTQRTQREISNPSTKHMNSKPIYDTDLHKPNYIPIEEFRNQLCQIRGQASDIVRVFPQWKERLSPVDGMITGVISYLAGVRKDMMEYSRKSKGGLWFSARGIGLDQVPCCYVCGSGYNHAGESSLMNNISGFVNSKEDGQAIVEMFEKGARLDFRPSEPTWIQVKIGACDKHLHCLEKLMSLTSDNGISPVDIEASKQ